MGRKKNYPVYTEVEVIDIAHDGKAIAKVITPKGQAVVLVSQAVPGDIIDIKILRKRKKLYEGVPITFHKYSDKRSEPFCEHFGLCGGCKWQNLAYKHQLYYKQKNIVDCLERIGNLELPEINSIIPSRDSVYYRNKIEYTFSNIRWFTEEELLLEEEKKNPNALGFHLPGMFDKILDINKCYLQDNISNTIRLALKDISIANNLEFYNHRANAGYLRNLIIRTSTIGQLMVILVLKYDDKPSREKILSELATKIPQITSLMYVINPKSNDSIADLETQKFCGEDYIMEQMDGLHYKIGAKSFFQVNTKQAIKMYRIIKEYAVLTGNETVYDLYTGTGTIANFIAGDAKKVIGLEFIEEAVNDANVNSELNNIDNTLFFAGDIKNIMNREFIKNHGKPDVIITDPPRAGMHQTVVSTILNALPKRVIYVSCNPATQARDLKLMSESYNITAVQPIDMFPHTHHVENIVCMEKR